MLQPPRLVIPTVIESTGRTERVFDIFSLLLRERIVFLGTPIDDHVADLIVAQLLYLDREDPERDIHLYINSPGGVVTAGLGILDTMRAIRPDVSTICIGQAASMGTVLLAGGARGKRYSLPNSRIHMHQPLGGARGQASDMEIEAREILRIRSLLNRILSEATGQPIERIARDTDRDYYMTADQAREYGLIDEILTSQKEQPEAVGG